MNAPQQRQALSETRMLCTHFECPDRSVPGPGEQLVIPLTFGAGDASVTIIVPAENADAIGSAIKRAAIAVPADAVEQAGDIQDRLDAMRRGDGR